MQILHRCDNRACVNPNHLFVGMQKDNVTDAISKGRQRHPVLLGENSSSAKLNWQQVQEIRKRYATEKISVVKLGRIYSVDGKTIWNAIKGVSWKRPNGIFSVALAAP
jgi:hypothetical protein